MRNNCIWRRLALLAAVVLLLSACAPAGKKTDNSDTALTWLRWGGYEGFWDLLGETEPDIEMEIIAYTGANYTGYSWAQMRADDITDLFSTSQILDEELVKERLADLSAYDFVDNLSTSVLDEVSIDGGIYLLPVTNSMYGIFYNKTLMEEKGWKLPGNFQELESLCAEIRAEGLIPGILGTQLTGSSFSAVFNLAKTSWLTTPAGISWERDFLAGNATAAGMWEGTMDYVQKYIDIGMFTTDPEDLANKVLIEEYLAGRKAVFFTMASYVTDSTLSNGDQLGMMPYIGEDGSKNVYMYSPSSYIGISKRLTEPGNEEKLEKAIRVLTLLYSPEGQATFITQDVPCVLSALDGAVMPEDSLIYDAQQAMWQGRAFRMTYAHWDNVLSDMGQAYKDWFRGENGMDGGRCIARMDELQTSYLNSQEEVYFCESTANFTLEETARLVGKALGSAVGADAAMIPYAGGTREGSILQCGITGKLYKDRINTDVTNTITPAMTGEYAILTMTGAQISELVRAGFDYLEDGNPYPYTLVVRGGGELEDSQTYQVAFLMESYSQEAGEAYSAEVYSGSIRDFLRQWLIEQKTVSPGGNPWE